MRACGVKDYDCVEVMGERQIMLDPAFLKSLFRQGMVMVAFFGSQEDENAARARSASSALNLFGLYGFGNLVRADQHRIVETALAVIGVNVPRLKLRAYRGKNNCNYYDSYSARYFVEEMTLQGFNMVRCIQGAKTLSLPMQMLGTDLQAHRVIYNNNPILKWCLTNTGVQTDRNGNIVPIKNQSPRQRIDGTAALLDCYVGLYEHYNEFINAI